MKKLENLWSLESRGLNASGAVWLPGLCGRILPYLFTFLVQAGFSIALCCGVRWVRWLFVAGGVIGAASTFLLAYTGR